MSVLCGPDISESGLVLYLDAANIKSYPGTGTVWTDLSGNGNTGTLINGPTFSSANGGSISFDGSNDYVNCGATNPLFNFGINDFTFLCHFQSLRNGAHNSFIAKDTTLPTANGWVVTKNDSNRIEAHIDGSWYSDGTAPTLTDSNFHQLAAVFKRASNVYFYIDALNYGVKSIADKAASSLTNSYPLMIGNSIRAANFYNGLISSVSIYSRALTAAEILQNYNALKGRYGL